MPKPSLPARMLETGDRVATRIPGLRDPSGLLVLLFHGVLPAGRDVSELPTPPELTVPEQDLRRFVRALHRASYRFIGPEELAVGLAPGTRAVLMTFDDGYANNLVLARLLAEEAARATIFVTTGHVRHGHAFWWDVLYRHTVGRGQPEELVKQKRSLQSQHPHEIASRLATWFGSESLQPVGELDRPLTPDEVRWLAQNPRITLGNHTRDHVLLDHVSRDEAEAQIAGCQKDLAEMTGERPSILAYPNGNYDAWTPKLARQCGLSFGVTTKQGRESTRSMRRRPMELRRFRPRWDRPLAGQLAQMRSGLQLRVRGGYVNRWVRQR